MRYLFGFICALALGLMGCSETAGTGGSGGSAGTGGMAGSGGTGGNEVACQDNVCPCTEAGIRAAIAEGGGPFTFDCEGPTTVVTEAEIGIDNDVILDGEGRLTADGGLVARVFSVAEGVTAELRGLLVTRGYVVGENGGGILNAGTLTLTDSSVFGNYADTTRFSDPWRSGWGGGILNAGTLALIRTTVSDNTAESGGGGIANFFGADATVTNSTVSGNTGGIFNVGRSCALIHSTVSRNSVDDGGSIASFGGGGLVTVANSFIDDDCAKDSDPILSNGYNIESPGDTCGFGQSTDQVNVPSPWLGVLSDNGGPTETHALFPPSVAIDVIPEVDCVDADGEPLTTDQRGVARPQGDLCDVGAFELEVAP